jgi:hypothetical protein
MLIESRKEECSIAPDRPSECEPKLMLLTRRLHIQPSRPCVEAAVSQVVKTGAMKFIRSGFRNHVHNRAACPPRLC